MITKDKRKPMEVIQGRSRTNQSGNALVLVVLLLFLLSAFALAQAAVVQKNIQSARFLLSYSTLRSYAESGIQLALHDLKYDLSANGGQIGTLNWTAANDTGQDGVPGTSDEGEGDGIPTKGESNVSPVTIGAADFGAGLTVYATDTLVPGIKHLVATASNADASAMVEVYARRSNFRFPRLGAIYVEPGVGVDLNGRSVLFDGNDHNPDGSAGPEPAVFGIATNVGDPPGTNQSSLLLQIPSKNYNQVLGLGGMPSIGESEMDLPKLTNALKGLKTQTLAAGTYTNLKLGDAAADDFQITYASGDLHFSGKGTGAGVLVVEGSVTFTGQFSFQGLVIVLGDARLSGSGTEAKIWGGLMVGQSLTDEVTKAKGAGATKIYYSSAALSRVEATLNSNYSIVYYNDQ
jgi:hypothetical protein